MKKHDLIDSLYDTIKQLGGKAVMIDIFCKFGDLHGKNLNTYDDLFCTWNYDICWAATELRKQGKMKPASTKENPH